MLNVNDVWEHEIFPRLPSATQVACRIVSFSWYIIISRVIAVIRRRQRIDWTGKPVQHPFVPRLPALRKLCFEQTLPRQIAPLDLASPVILAQLTQLSLVHTVTLTAPLIRSLRHVQYLELRQTACKMYPLYEMEQLKTLVLISCTITDVIPQRTVSLPASMEMVYSRRTHYYYRHPLELFQNRTTALYLSIHIPLDVMAQPLRNIHLNVLSATLTELILMYHDSNHDAFDVFSSLSNLVLLHLQDTPFATPVHFAIPYSLRTLHITGQWVITDAMCATFGMLDDLLLDCNLDIWRIGLSRLYRLRRLELTSISELHSSILPVPSTNLTALYHTFGR